MEDIIGDVHYIYTIKDPRTDTIFYVGRTKNIDQRVSCHMAQNMDILKIKEAGFKPIFNIVHKCCESDASKYENIFISYYENQGYNLSNSICRKRKHNFKELPFVLTSEQELEIESKFTYPLK